MARTCGCVGAVPHRACSRHADSLQEKPGHPARVAAHGRRGRGAGAAVAAARDQSDALKVLHLPHPSLNAQGIGYRKTVRASPGGLRTPAEASATGILDGIAASGVPGLPDDAVDPVITQMQDAVPDLFAGIPDSVSLRARLPVPEQTAPRPSHGHPASAADWINLRKQLAHKGTFLLALRPMKC